MATPSSGRSTISYPDQIFPITAGAPVWGEVAALDELLV
jgi:hypothetical protein